MLDYHKVDVQALLEIARIAENTPDELFLMKTWGTFTDCGTVACLIGNWYVSKGEITGLKNIHPNESVGQQFDFHDISDRLNIPETISLFLFGDHLACTSNRAVKEAFFLNKEQAISRLRKVIYYILHKREIMGLDKENWREIYEEARRAGDIGVANKVSEDVLTP